MGAWSYDELKNHVGHDVIVAHYAGDGPFANVAVECETCGCVLFDYDNTDGEDYPIPIDIETEEDGSVYIYGYGQEIVMWSSDEFAEGPEAIIAAFNAIDYGHHYGAHALAKSIGKKWNGSEWAVDRG